MNNLLQKLKSKTLSPSGQEAEKLLAELRQEVDDIDVQVVRLLIRRIKVSLYIGKVKRLLKLQSYSPEREKKILDNVISLAPDDLTRKIVMSIYERIVDESRALQKMRTGDEQ